MRKNARKIGFERADSFRKARVFPRKPNRNANENHATLAALGRGPNCGFHRCAVARYARDFQNSTGKSTAPGANAPKRARGKLNKRRKRKENRRRTIEKSRKAERSARCASRTWETLPAALPLVQIPYFHNFFRQRRRPPTSRPVAVTNAQNSNRTNLSHCDADYADAPPGGPGQSMTINRDCVNPGEEHSRMMTAFERAQ